MPIYDYSIEYCHIYTNEYINEEHAASIAALEHITQALQSHGATYSLCVMVDDYSFPGQNFDYSNLLDWLTHNKAAPHFLSKEAALIPTADEVVAMVKNKKRKRSLYSYIERKRYPCSLFIAAWYLARLGKVTARPRAITSSARQLINILPQRFEPAETEAKAILADTPYVEVLGRIQNHYLEGRTIPTV